MEFDIEKRFYPEEYQSSEEYRLSAYNSQYNQFLDYHSINKNKNHSLDTLNNEYDEYQDSFKPFTSARVSSNKEDFFANRSSENMDKRIAFTNTRDSDLKIKVSKTKIFAIKKEIKRGRRKSCIINFKKAKHSKFDKDNIIRKIKTRFINSAKDYINNINDKFYSSKNNKNKPLLKKINPKFPKALSKQENRKFLELNTKQMFSENLMERFKHSCKDYNKKNIEELYQKKEAKEVIQIMDKKVSDLYKDYISSTIPEFSLKQDLKEIAKKGGSKYADKYEEISINLIEILSSSRKKRKKTFNVFEQKKNNENM